MLRKVKGVTKTEVGYTGGTLDKPSYEDVCTDKTGHVEVIQLEYDPRILPYRELLKIFFEEHNPTTPDRQGPNVGTQYRSAIFYHSPQQKSMALEFIEELQASGKYKNPIVTEVLEAQTFYRAEEYHQRYIQKRTRGL